MFLASWKSTFNKFSNAIIKKSFVNNNINYINNLNINLCRMFSSKETNKNNIKPHIKLKIPTKRAAHLLNILENEGVQKSLKTKEFDRIDPGDAVEVKFMENITTEKILAVRGVVIGKRNRGLSSSIQILNHYGGVGAEQKIFLHSPLLKSIKVVTKAHIHQGKKRVRRAKLYYLRDLPSKVTTIN